MPDIEKMDDLGPQQYPIDIEFDSGDEGKTKKASIATTDRPFVIQMITHQIIKDPQNIPPIQDGMYRINWSIFNRLRFFEGAVPFADIAFGSSRTGIWIPLPRAVVLPSQTTISVEVTNAIQRTDPIAIQMIFMGQEQAERDLTEIIPA